MQKAPPRFGKTKMWTRTPEKIALEQKEKEKQRKKQKCSSTKPMRRAKIKQRFFDLSLAKEVAAALMQASSDDHKYDLDSDLSWDPNDE